jgi:hypothetical protein
MGLIGLIMLKERNLRALQNRLVPTAARRILCCWLSGACETMSKCISVQEDYVQK